VFLLVNAFFFCAEWGILRKRSIEQAVTTMGGKFWLTKLNMAHPNFFCITQSREAKVWLDAGSSSS